MKKSLVALAVLGSLTGLAHADQYDGNSVVLYGVIDEGVRYTTHQDGDGHGKFQIGDGAESGSRFGFKGSESLGGGLHAIFTLEGGFSAGTGQSAQGNRLFGRQAFVGLQSDQYGTLTFGRQKSLGYEFIEQTDPYAVSNINEVAGSQYELTGPRWDNSVKYKGQFSGVSVASMYSAGNQTGSFGTDRGWGVSLGYDYQALQLRALYQASNDTRFGTIGSVPEEKQKLASLGATYTYGPAQVFAEYFNNRYDQSNLIDNIYNLGATYNLTPVVALRGAVAYDRQGGSDGSRWTYSAESSYALSKRTDVYAEADFTKLKGGYTDPTYNFNTPTNGANTRLGATVGLRHKF